jgi:predicted nucleic acid-binding protein
VRRLLELVVVAGVDANLGYAAGSLRQEAIRGGADPAPSGVDAIVAALADARAAHVDVEIITSDGEDLELLASFGEHAARVEIAVV